MTFRERWMPRFTSRFMFHSWKPPSPPSFCPAALALASWCARYRGVLATTAQLQMLIKFPIPVSFKRSDKVRTGTAWIVLQIWVNYPDFNLLSCFPDWKTVSTWYQHKTKRLLELYFPPISHQVADIVFVFCYISLLLITAPVIAATHVESDAQKLSHEQWRSAVWSSVHWRRGRGSPQLGKKFFHWEVL